MKNNFFEVLRPGINTTYQDQGRFGLQHFGVVPGGCMDEKLFLIINKLLGNKSNEGVIEFAYQGPLLKFCGSKTKFAVSGDVHFNIINSKNKIINGDSNKSYNLDNGDQIDIISTKKSVYGYFGVYGGFKVKSFYKSISTLTKANIGPNNGNKISLSDKIFINTERKSNNTFHINFKNNYDDTIRVLKGPQYDYFSEESKKDFFSKEYLVTNLSDRMGMRLEGEIIKNTVSANIRSEGITKGAIQVPADGQPIVLLTDHPTIGGYPKIANVVSADYNKLIQKTPGTKLKFKCINLEEAEKLYKDHFNNISKLLNNLKEI